MMQQPNARNCFVCGVGNQYGLRMRFFENEDEVHAEYSVPERFQGYPGIAHGGVIAAMLDEVGSRTFFRGDPPRFVVTAKMKVRFRRPVPIGVQLRIVGKQVADHGRVCRAQSQVYHPDGTLLAEADLTLTEVPPEFFGGFSAMEEQGWRMYGEEFFQDQQEDDSA